MTFYETISFVGSRPALFNQADLIALRTEKGNRGTRSQILTNLGHIPLFLLHRLIPGITGWAQINGRDDIPIPKKVEFDE